MPAVQRTVALAWQALDEALTVARHPEHADSGLRIGVCLGTTVGAQLNDMEFYDAFRRLGNPPLTAVRRFLHGNLAERIAARLGATGPRSTLVNACSSGADAIGLALSWLRAGWCDIAVAGGADELSLVPFCGFTALGIVSAAPCRPFDRDRSGLNLGEGAGVLVLESDRSARARGTVSGVELAGYGAAADAFHLTGPHPEGRGLRTAIRVALDMAGAAPDDVAFVNAHGTATRDNDRVEAAVLADLFGPGLNALSSKRFTGHTLGAAGGLEAVFTVLGLREGWVPGSAGFRTADPELALRPVTEQTAVTRPCAVSTSLAFGGSNAALVFRKGAG